MPFTCMLTTWSPLWLRGSSVILPSQVAHGGVTGERADHLLYRTRPLLMVVVGVACSCPGCMVPDHSWVVTVRVTSSRDPRCVASFLCLYATCSYCPFDHSRVVMAGVGTVVMSSHLGHTGVVVASRVSRHDHAFCIAMLLWRLHIDIYIYTYIYMYGLL